MKAANKMTRKKTLKRIEALANSLNEDKGLEDAASILYILAGTIALENRDALNSLCMHNVLWADSALKAIQSADVTEGTPPPKSNIMLPGEE